MQRNVRSVERSFSLHWPCDPDPSPLFWLPERHGRHSAVWGHVPFAHWLMCGEAEGDGRVGTYNGVSYTAFCQAVLREQLETHCFAVDTWVWVQKISQHGVTLFHDINVRLWGFGVWQLWRELEEKDPHFEFHHCYGLGVIALGSAPPQPVAEPCRIGSMPEGPRCATASH